MMEEQNEEKKERRIESMEYRKIEYIEIEEDLSLKSIFGFMIIGFIMIIGIITISFHLNY